MRSRADVCLMVVLLGCSSAATLPSGGPFGGAADDAGVVVGTATTATSSAGVDASIVFMTGTSSSGSGSGLGASSGSGSSKPPPTWTYLYDTYLSTATPTIGSCDGGSCHYHAECSSPAACYAWIACASCQAEYGLLANGGGMALFTWDDGNGYMPQGGATSDAAAQADFAAWATAGSLDN